MKKIYCILMLAMAHSKRYIVVLDIPDDIDGFLSYAWSVFNSMALNPIFATLAPKLAQFKLDLTALQDAHNGFNSEPPTNTKGLRDEKLVIVNDSLRSFNVDVQALVDATPADAENIATSAKMKLKKKGGQSAREDKVIAGANEGEVILTGKGKGEHHFQQSPDGGVNVINLEPAHGGKLVLTGLTSGSKLWFRNRQVLSKGQYGDWSPWIAVRVP